MKLEHLKHIHLQLENLPLSLDIGRLKEDEHKAIFLQSFRIFLQANKDILKAQTSLIVEIEKSISWQYEDGAKWQESLMSLADMAYESWNDYFVLFLKRDNGSIQRIKVVMDPVYYGFN